jgi:hypothetical protein
MISPAEITQKATRKYNTFLKAKLAGESLFPMRIPAKMAASSTPWSALRQWMSRLMAEEKAKKGYGYTVVLGEPMRTRTHGMQSLPDQILIESEKDFLRLLEKEKEVETFLQNVAFIRKNRPELENWLTENVAWIIKYEADWAGLLRVCQYFLENPQPQLYMRELPIAVHSKFMEGRTDILRRLLDELLPEAAICTDESRFEYRFGIRKAPLRVRFRILDATLTARLGFPGDDLSLSMEDFAKLPFAGKRIIISENLIPFLTMPSLKETIGIFGEGNAVSALQAPWLASCDILYWGDLDQQGFRFLSNFRSNYPQTQSIFMDLATIELYAPFSVTGTPDETKDPGQLTAAEKAAYDFVKTHNMRLEQENIDHFSVVELLKSR